MDPEDAVHQTLNAHIEAALAVRDSQTPALVASAQRLVRCLLEERRIFVCGNGSSGITAQHLTVKMLGRLERERPGLPVFCLVESAPLATALAGNYGNAEVFARQLRALGQSGDVLVALAAAGTAADTVQAIISAHDRGMDVIALTGHEGGDVARVLANDDIEIRVPALSATRAEEIHLVLTGVLCDLLERELFGDPQ